MFIKIAKSQYFGDVLNANKFIGKEDNSKRQKLNINNLENDLSSYDINIINNDFKQFFSKKYYLKLEITSPIKIRIS